MGQPFVLMHISDLHFHKFPRNPALYASKRTLGALNLALRRMRQYPPGRAERLVNALRDADWSHLLITGDLVQLGWEGEFALARRVLEPLLSRGAERVTVIPGNHDRYVQEPPGEEGFRAYFGAFSPDGGPLFRHLDGPWHMAAWDSAVPAPWHSAAGRVAPETLSATGAWISALPEPARVIVANHYPVFYPPPFSFRRNRDLANQEQVEDWLLGHPVELYLHGHLHHNWCITVPGRQRTLRVVNSASTTQRPRPGRPSDYHRIVLEEDGHRVRPMLLEGGQPP